MAKKRHLTSFARRVLEYLDRHGSQTAYRIGEFIWPLTATRGHSSHGGPNRAAFAAGNAMGKLRVKGLITWGYSRKYEPQKWAMSAKGGEALKKAREAEETFDPGISEKMARALVDSFQLDQVEADRIAVHLIITNYRHFWKACWSGRSSKRIFDVKYAIETIGSYSCLKDAPEKTKRGVAKVLKTLILEEEHKRLWG